MYLKFLVMPEEGKIAIYPLWRGRRVLGMKVTLSPKSALRLGEKLQRTAAEVLHEQFEKSVKEEME